MLLAQSIVENRKKLKMSQSLVAQKIGVSRQAISLYEINKAQPSLEIAVRLARLFDITLDELINGKTE